MFSYRTPGMIVACSPDFDLLRLCDLLLCGFVSAQWHELRASLAGVRSYALSVTKVLTPIASRISWRRAMQTV